MTLCVIELILNENLFLLVSENFFVAVFNLNVNDFLCESHFTLTISMGPKHENDLGWQQV